MGQYNELVILRESDLGQILDAGDELGDVLLPSAQVDPDLEPGDTVKVFLYRDSEDRPIATRETPQAQVGDIVLLKVIDTGRVGAFLDWGLPKDLLLPHSNQKGRPQAGDFIVVEILLDEVSGRIVATQKILRKALESRDRHPTYARGRRVQGLVASGSEMGWTVIVEGAYLGMLYANEVFRTLREGDEVEVYVREIRLDGRIDLSLEPTDHSRIPPLRNRILTAIEEAGGFLPLHDRSSPAEIQRAFECSKKNFKKAVGALYREKRIDLSPEGLRLRDAG